MKSIVGSVADAALHETAVWGVASAPRPHVDAIGRRRTLPPLLDRFMANLQAEGDCWVWTGSRTPNGYGQFKMGAAGARSVVAHRWSYTLFRSEIPAGLQLDHLCRTPACVNPWHLEPVSASDNALRGANGPTRGRCTCHVRVAIAGYCPVHEPAPCPVYSHGDSGWHCAVQGEHQVHRNAAGTVAW